MSQQPILRLRFPILNRDMVPVEHGEALYAALCRKIPIIHNYAHVGISGIRGAMSIGGHLILDERSGFYIQCPQDLVAQLVQLAGSNLDLRGKKVRIGIPQILPILPAETLVARYVTVRGKETEDALYEYLAAYIQNLHGSDWLPCTIQILRRRIITLHGKKIYGFGVVLDNIGDPELSVAIQTHPPGGRRRYGGSFFLPGRWNFQTDGSLDREEIQKP